jgi:hypothetical protein
MTSTGDLQIPGPAGARIADQLGWYDRKSVLAQRKYKGLKLLQLAAAAAVPVFAASGVGAAATAALGGALLVLEGLQQVGQYHRIWIDYRSTWELLQREKFLFLSRAGDYARARDAAQLLAERVEAVVAQESTGWSTIQESAAKKEEQERAPEEG